MTSQKHNRRSQHSHHQILRPTHQIRHRSRSRNHSHSHSHNAAACNTRRGATPAYAASAGSGRTNAGCIARRARGATRLAGDIDSQNLFKKIQENMWRRLKMGKEKEKRKRRKGECKAGGLETGAAKEGRKKARQGKGKRNAKKGGGGMTFVFNTTI